MPCIIISLHFSRRSSSRGPDLMRYRFYILKKSEVEEECGSHSRRIPGPHDPFFTFPTPPPVCPALSPSFHLPSPLLTKPTQPTAKTTEHPGTQGMAEHSIPRHNLYPSPKGCLPCKDTLYTILKLLNHYPETPAHPHAQRSPQKAHIHPSGDENEKDIETR